jgi:RNA polymerase sigma factor (sigma-70 family)
MSLPSGIPDEEELWRRAATGSPDAWDEVFVRHHRAIYNYCFRRTGQWSAAEDLTSTVFLEAWRRRTEARPRVATALPWLYGIATMLTRNHHRTLRRYRDALERIPAPEPGADVADDVAARVDAERQAVRAAALLRRLPRADREVLELAATGRLDHAQIAAALDIPLGTVKSRLSRARHRLGEQLDRGISDGSAPDAPGPVQPGARPRRS